MMGSSSFMRLRFSHLFLPRNRSSIRTQIRTPSLSHNAENDKPGGLAASLDIISRQRWIHSGTSHMLGTTVLCVRKDQTVVIIADGQVTLGSEIIKPNVRKLRRIGENVIGGFAGATADALTLFERLENQLEEHSGQLTRAAVELAKAWRTDKFLRRLDAVMVVADSEITLTITGNGDVLEPHDGVVAIGSGGPYAIAAARALIDLPDFNAESVARKAMKIAADSCIYTNHNFTIERIESQTTESSQVGSQQAVTSICTDSNKALNVSSEHGSSSDSSDSDNAIEKNKDNST